MKEPNLIKYSDKPKKLILYVGMYTTASILGPLLLFGGIGYILDRIFNTRPWLLIISVFIAFIFTNIFLYKKVVALTNLFNNFPKKEEGDQ